MNSPEQQKYIDELSEFINKLGTKKELCRRIAEALSCQDSCGECCQLTMKGILQTGTSGLITCASCTNEFLVESIAP